MITVVGMDGSALTPRAEAALAAATLVAGARRHLAAFPVLTAPGRAQTVVLGELAPALDALAAHDGDAVVLASGDPGFFGIVRALRERGLTFTVLPAVSSVALAFARAGLAWDDAVVVSTHGRDPRPAVNVCRAYSKVAVLTGPGCGPAEIGAALDGWDRRLIVAEHLGTEDERLTECSPARGAEHTWEDPNVVLVLGTAPLPHSRHPSWMWDRCPSRGTSVRFMREGAVGWALAEEEFDSRDAVMTKAEVRALALARLGPGPGMLVWDVGAGSGSVGIECARFGAAVIAVERDAVRCERARANATGHGVDVRVVPGEAPQALAELPDPDAVFVGGGGPRVIEAVAARRPARIVVALAAVERVSQAIAALDAAGYATGGALVQAARFAPLPGDVHRLAATNPVFLVWATAGPGATEPVSAAALRLPGSGATEPVSPAGPRLPGPGSTEPGSPGDHFGPGTRDTGPGAPR
ncbi:MAG TPA: precorrin-6y C5,15-methyltransferase (decarboxylating) subunit CbiE [Streptosporangiaceae bacterium]